MSDLMNLDEIKKQYEIERTGEQSPVIDFKDESHKTPNLIDTTMQQVVGHAVTHQLHSDETRQRVLKTADKVINTHMSKVENEAEQGEKEAIFANNKDACDLYGIDEKTVPKWVVAVARLVQNFWYFVWLIIGSITTAPIVFLGKKIKVIIKRTWLAMILSVLIYALLATSPLWRQLLKL